MYIETETTPNPAVLKFLPGREVMPAGTREFAHEEDAAASPLAAAAEAGALMFAIGFTTLKSNIPKVNPFSWDETFMEMDRWMHFGTLPHEILAPLFQYPLVTFVMNFTYNAWFFMLMGFYLWQGFRDRDTPLRQRFLLAYLLSKGNADDPMFVK